MKWHISNIYLFRNFSFELQGIPLKAECDQNNKGIVRMKLPNYTSSIPQSHDPKCTNFSFRNTTSTPSSHISRSSNWWVYPTPHQSEETSTLGDNTVKPLPSTGIPFLSPRLNILKPTICPFRKTMPFQNNNSIPPVMTEDLVNTVCSPLRHLTFSLHTAWLIMSWCFCAGVSLFIWLA